MVNETFRLSPPTKVKEPQLNGGVFIPLQNDHNKYNLYRIVTIQPDGRIVAEDDYYETRSYLIEPSPGTWEVADGYFKAPSLLARIFSFPHKARYKYVDP